MVHSLRVRENLQKILERNVDSAVRGERVAQQKLYEAEAEVEARNWEKQGQDIEQAQKGEFSLYGEIGIEKQALPRKSYKRLPRN